MDKECTVRAVDPATTTGLAYVTFHGGALSCLTRKCKFDLGDRGQSVRLVAQELSLMDAELESLGRPCPVESAIEDQYSHLNPDTFKKLVRVSSWFEYELLVRYQTKVTFRTPSNWQKFFGLNSRKHKSALRKKVVYRTMKRVFGREFASNDVSDALGIGVVHLAHIVGEDIIYAIIRPHLEAVRKELGL